ncbi:MAG TPA: hypothetical protein PLV92_03430, partial [Pirellulaceae bacterium]|nr:hypothetical protein [Pirellulaceae bacterium]
MPVQVQCPTCKAVLTAPDEVAGKPATCPQCAERFLVPAGALAAGTGAGAAASAVPPPGRTPPLNAPRSPSLLSGGGPAAP